MDFDQPVRMDSGVVSLGTEQSHFYWWDDKTDRILHDVPIHAYDLDFPGSGWRKEYITEDELPSHCRETLKVAGAMDPEDIPLCSTFLSRW